MSHPVQWLSDSGPVYTAHDRREVGRSLALLVCTAPAYSPESNGMAEALVKSFKCDYVYAHVLHSAAYVLAQLPASFEDYDAVHPLEGLGMRSQHEDHCHARRAHAP